MRHPIAAGAVVALIFNACVWGLSWWPLRQLDARGLHPLWTTGLVFLLCSTGIALLRPRALPHLLRTPSLWWLLLGAGTTNAAFNWGVVAGDVVRVVLLFYLMPLWSLLLARWLLGEALTLAALLRAGLAVLGALIVLAPASGGAGAPAIGLGETLGLIGGMSFAFNNVMLRRLAHEPRASRALAMFSGGAIVSLGLVLLMRPGLVPDPAPWSAWPAWVLGLLPLAGLFLLGNLALQYGASRLPAQVTSLVMLCEILFATASAWALGGGQLSLRTGLGGALILAAAAASVRASTAPRPAPQ